MFLKQNTNCNYITTYSKVVSLLAIVSVVFLIGFSILFCHSYKQYVLMTSVTTKQFEKEADALLKLNSDVYSTLINEITYWDELVDFIQNKNINWFNNSLSYLVNTSKVDLIEAYSLNEKIISKAAKNKIKSSNFIPKSVFAKLYIQNNIHFFIKVPEGILEVFGSTIHPSHDPFKTKTTAKGYLFIAKLIDNEYLLHLEKIIGAKIFYSHKKQESSNNIILFNKLIHDCNGKKIGCVTFARNNSINFTSTRNVLLLLLFLFLCSMGVFLFYAKKWAQKPIKLIKEVLENGNQAAIDKLKNIKGEFRRIGILFEETQNQKKLITKAKLKAEENDMLKTAFLTNLSHEIRTPLNAIMGFADLINCKKISENEREEYLKIINKSGSNLILIIDDLIEMSKIDTNQLKPNKKSINPDDFFIEIYNSLEVVVNKKPLIDFIFKKPKKPFVKNIILDDVKFRQVIYNLITNAVKFTNKGFITFEYDYTPENLELKIEDSGIGIENKNLNLIFDRFRKIDTETTINNAGLGLGLAISKAYIEMMGGTIFVESAIGVGTTFFVNIPLLIDKKIKKITNDFLTIQSNLNIENEHSARITILVAEDDNINYLLLEKILKLKKYKVIRAVDGQDAINKCLNTNNIDLILMDIKMPKLNGYEAFAKIKSFRPRMPIIAQTAFSSSEELKKIRKIGFNDCITKPLNKEILLQLIEKTLA